MMAWRSNGRKREEEKSEKTETRGNSDRVREAGEEGGGRGRRDEDREGGREGGKRIYTEYLHELPVISSMQGNAKTFTFMVGAR